MLIGGFYSVDPALINGKQSEQDIPLRCDIHHQYSRKVYTNNGRTATVYALQNGLRFTKHDVILLPDYLCVSVLNALEVSGAQFRYYRVKRDLTIDLDDLASKMDDRVKVIYVIHYFGIPQPLEAAEKLLALKKQYGACIIEDLTQTLYTVCSGRIGFGDFLVASTRKWLPVTDGGLLAVKDHVACSFPSLEDGYDEAVYQQLLITIMRKYYAEHPDADISYYLEQERKANAARYLDFTPKAPTELSQRIMFGFDHAAAIAQRIEHYAFLFHELEYVPGLELLAKPLDSEGGFVPFGFPVLVENRQDLYNFLASHGIVGEIQWILPTDYYSPGADARYLSEHNIMLQCDQRYGRKEMEYIVSCLKRFAGG